MLKYEPDFVQARSLISAMKAECTKQESHMASNPKVLLHLLGQFLALFCPLLYLQCLEQCLDTGIQ